jgi:hypothetical protein
MDVLRCSLNVLTLADAEMMRYFLVSLGKILKTSELQQLVDGGGVVIVGLLGNTWKNSSFHKKGDTKVFDSATVNYDKGIEGGAGYIFETKSKKKVCQNCDKEDGVRLKLFPSL